MSKAYYEAYWESEEAPPARDPTTPARKRRLMDALRRLGIPEGSRILDLGCGTGEFTRFVADHGYQAFGVDIASTPIERARSRHPGVRFERLDDNLGIPAGPGTFDAVWSTEVIEHVLDVGAYLAEVRRVLRDDGLFILTTPYHARLKNVLVCLAKFDRHFDPEGGHIRFFDRRGLERCLARAGLQPVEWSGIGRCWPLHRTWFVVSRKLAVIPS